MLPPRPQTELTRLKPTLMANKTTGHAHDAFASVDKAVAKAVVGSDGAASWQNFRKEANITDPVSSAPGLQVKRSDRLGTGFTSLEQERAHETALRERGGQDKVGVGYQVFTQKHDKQAFAGKEQKRTRQRIRPQSHIYFSPSKQFDGFRFDYVFTTKNGATGYYWDGMDSLKRLGSGVVTAAEKSTFSQSTSTTELTWKSEPQIDSPKTRQIKQPKKKKRKKDNTTKQTPVIIHDPNNALEIVANAILNRNGAKSTPPGGGLPDGWETASDSTGKTYYFHRATNKRQWQKPTVANLPSTWKVARDSSGKQYYYNDEGETTWQNPT